MKRKIALLLSVIMAFSLVPATTIFAGSNNRISREAMVIPSDGTGWSLVETTAGVDLEYAEFSDKYEENRGRTTLIHEEKWTKAPYLVLVLNDHFYQNDSFRLRLENAEWDVRYVSGVASGDATNATGEVVVDHVLETVKANVGAYNHTSLRELTNGVNGTESLGFTLTVNPTDRSVATITNIKNEAPYTYSSVDDNNVLIIPLAAKIANNYAGNVTVEVENNNSAVNAGIYVIANTLGSGTYNFSKSPSVSGREMIELGTIVIRENRPGTIRNGDFKLRAPNGYQFANSPRPQGGKNSTTKQENFIETTKPYKVSDFGYGVTLVSAGASALTYTQFDNYTVSNYFRLDDYGNILSNGNYLIDKEVTPGDLNGNEAIDAGEIEIEKDKIVSSAARTALGLVVIARDVVVAGEAADTSLNGRYWIFSVDGTALKNRTDVSVAEPNVKLADGTNVGSRYLLSETYGTASNPGYTEEYKIELLGITPTATTDTRLTGELIIENIKIEPIYDSYVGDTDLYLDLTGVNDCGISTGPIKVAESREWTVKLSTQENPTDILSGQKERTTAEFRFEELQAGAWDGERTTTFTLPEGVSIAKINFNHADYIDETLSAPLKSSDNKNDWQVNLVDAGQTVNYKQGTVSVSDDGRSFTIKSVRFKSSTNQPDQRAANQKRARFDVRLQVNVAPSFGNYAEADLNVTVSGTSLPTEFVNNGETTIKIATVKPAVTIATSVTDVEIGYQSYKVADIEITETQAGAIRRDGQLVIALNDFYDTNSDMYFAPITANQVTYTDDISLSLARTTNGTITFNIGRPSIYKPAVITIKGAEIKINRNVPWGEYDLTVYGDSVYNNYVDWDSSKKTGGYNTIVGVGEKNDGYRAAFINVVTPGSAANAVKQFKLTVDSNVAIVGDKTVELVGAPYINEDGRTMIPLRDIGTLLDGQVYWSADTSTAAVVIGNKTISFVTDDPNYYLSINNSISMPIKMDTAPEITDDRMYLPFRAAAEAFGFTVNWDEETQTITANSGVEKVLN